MIPCQHLANIVVIHIFDESESKSLPRFVHDELIDVRGLVVDADKYVVSQLFGKLFCCCVFSGFVLKSPELLLIVITQLL